MKTIGLDTSNRFLIVCLMDKQQVVAYHQELAFKNQSEKILAVINQLFKQVGWNPKELEQIVITVGPGSYTGVRIAMTIAKVIATRLNIPLYTISTLQFYAGTEHRKILLDARGKRTYFAEYKDGQAIQQDQIKLVDELADDFKNHKAEYIGDLNVFGVADNYPDFKMNFLRLSDYWQKVDDIHHLKPNYLKEQEEYMVSK